MRPLARPHGISPEPFLVYPPDLHHWVTVAFWTLRLFARSSTSVAFLSGSCPSGHDFAMASSLLYLAVQNLPVAIGFVGNYVPWDFHPSFGTCPSYKKDRPSGRSGRTRLNYSAAGSAEGSASGSGSPLKIAHLFSNTGRAASTSSAAAPPMIPQVRSGPMVLFRSPT